ncbi:MAG: cytochrome C oxidase subunit IV family protein [Thiopseudomonas sp.]|nr:cytochrome C oxidase subunit IV family protein [Thiopseudomonas sp.]MCK9464492.1 cytochrome C oxidase subunit IV family protein [Thiopseudomonas sp.]
MKQKSNEVVLFACWLVLILATMVTVYWGAQQTTLVLQVVVILIIAILKAGVIIDGFMELRHASVRWRMIMYGWPVAMSAIIAVTLLAAQTG